MSNEKPVRITVGDVKEVTEATTIQADTVVSKPVSAVSYTASVPDTSGNGMVMGAGVIGFILVILAGYFGLTREAPKPANPGSSAPAITAPTKTAPDNTTAATNAPATTESNNAASNAPAPTTTDANNAAANTPAPATTDANNAAVNTPAPATNNAPSK